MTDDIKPPTWKFALRATTDDRAILERVIAAYAKMGLQISLNDAVLVLIRRAAAPDADTQEEALAALRHHWSSCPHGCRMETWPPRCPEGWRLRGTYQRVVAKPLPRHSPAPLERRAG
jgi:hypothetical protein